MSIYRSLKSLAVGGLLLGLLSPISHAQSGSSNDWQFRVTPYLFGTGLDGDIGFNDALPPVSVEATFGDVVDNLDFGFMLFAEARKGRWGIWGDGMYVDLGVETETPFPIVLIYSGIELDVTLKTLAAGGSYSILTGDSGWLDVVAGARYWSVDQELTFIGFNDAVPDRAISAGESWTDPVIGLRGQASLSDRWRLNGHGVGSAGGKSESSIDVMANIGYSFNDLFTLSLGYRYLDVDFEDEDFLFDVQFQGPVIGASFAW
jgi:hypothetical protein